MWYFQSVWYHVIPSNCFITCDTFKLFYSMWYLQSGYIMWYIQTVVCHVIHSNCFMPCDTCGKKPVTHYYFITRVCSITVPFSFRNDNNSTSLFCNMMHSNCLMPCDTFKLIYTMWCIQTLLCHVIPSNCFIPCDILKLFIPCDTLSKLFIFHVILSICFIPCDAFKLLYTMWYL
jgi:hypothetical protein